MPPIVSATIRAVPGTSAASAKMPRRMAKTLTHTYIFLRLLVTSLTEWGSAAGFDSLGVDTAVMMKIRARVPKIMTADRAMPATTGERLMVRSTVATISRMTPAIASRLRVWAREAWQRALPYSTGGAYVNYMSEGKTCIRLIATRASSASE